jgi:type IX secretion system PorP/SprF family membrane protein
MNINVTAIIKCKKYILLIIGGYILLCPFINVGAQQVPLYSQYTFSPFVLNPAAAGAEGYTTITITSRNQWLGIKDAPRIYSASGQTRFMKQSHIRKDVSVKRKYKNNFHSGRVGLGFSVYNFHAGQIDQTGAQFAYAYHISFKKTSQLSMGASIGYLKYKINTENLQLTDITDDPVYNNRISMNIPDVNIGIYYSDQNKYIGLSILQLLQASMNFSNYENEDFLIYRHFYLIAGYKYNLSSLDVLEPSLFLKSSEQLRFQVDASLKYIRDNKFWIGIGYRSGLTFIGSIGLSIHKFYFGYSFDYSPRGLLNYSYGSHEVMLAIKLGDNARRYRYLDRY